MKSTGYNSRTSWIAAIASAGIGFLVVIPMRLAGFFFVILIDQYKVDREHATIPIVVYGTLRTVTGPFIGYLGQAFGLRATTMLGCLLTSVGIGACYFAKNITEVTVYLGLIYGTGFGLSVSLIPEILKQHFIKDINMAVGIYGAGTCVGAIVMSPVLQFLVNHYGYSGMFLILSAIILNSIPAAMLLKDPKNGDEVLGLENTTKLCNHFISNLNKPQEVDKIQSNLDFVSDKANEVEKGLYIINAKREEFDTILHCDLLPQFSVNDMAYKEHSYVNDALDLRNEENVNDKSRIEISVAEVVSNKEDVSYKLKTGNNKETEYSLTHLSSKKKFKTESHTAISEKIECCGIHAKEEKHDLRENQSTFNVDILQPSKKIDNKTWKSFQLFLDPTFYLTMIVQSAHAFVTTLSWTILLDFARDSGISVDNSLYFLMFLPVAEMFGNLCLNWITDRGYMTRTKYCMTCYLILGVDILYIVWSYNFTMMMVGVLIFGCFSGSLATTFPGMIFEFFEEEQHSMALTSRFFLYAFLCLTKSPLVGFFRESLGSYNWVFYIITISCVSCAILVTFTPYIASCRKKKFRQRSETRY